ncbi:Fc.00g023150.m01.CDS01 [Cosmosporella sp. VM-42]
MATSPKTTDAPPPGNSIPNCVEYSYMFEKDKSPSKLLDALLRAIGRHIVQEIGDKCVTELTPQKLAAFYKAVGGDYDSLFVDMPHASISYIWQVTGCQHTLQPTDNDFDPPTIPALTPRGFSRWESLEILLGPEEHVPFMQFAVKNWQLKHPETGQDFPQDLPKEMFPTEPDEQVDRWHKSCADKLRKEAAAKEKEPPKNEVSPEQQPEPKFAYVHVRNPFPNTRQRPSEQNYFERPVSYVHVPGPRATAPRAARHSPDKYRQGSQSDDHARRRSFSDIPPGQDIPAYTPGATYLDPNMKRPVQPRRHSQPRHFSTDSSEEEPIPQRMKRRQNTSPPSPPSVRRFVPPADRLPPGSATAPPFRHRPDMRPEDPRRRSVPSPSFREKLSEKVSSMLPNGKGSERPRNHVRHNSYNSDRARRSREQIPPSRLSRSYSDLDSEASSDPETSNEEIRRRRRVQERERDRDRDRYREKERGRPRDPDREREEERRERQYMRRPEVERRTSSHADIDRRRDRDHQSWDPRNRDQIREDRKRWDKRVPPDERGPSPVTGVGGRRYPPPEATYP